MPTATITWAFATTSNGWVATAAGSGNAPAYQASLGNPAGSLGNITTGRSKAGSGRWDLSGTWESLFGVPAGSIVTAILVSGDGYQAKCNTYSTGAASTDGPLELRDSVGNLLLTLVAGRAYSAVDSAWVTRSPGSLNQAIPSAQQASNSSIALRLNGSVNTGASSSANNTLLQDTVKITVTYALPTVTMALSATEAPDTLSAAATDPVAALLAATETPDSFAAALADPVGMALAATEARDTLSAAVNVAASGVSMALAATEARDTLSAAVSSLIAAQMAAQESADHFSASVGALVAGALSVTEARDVLAAAMADPVAAAIAGQEMPDLMVLYVDSGTPPATEICEETWHRMKMGLGFRFIR